MNLCSQQVGQQGGSREEFFPEALIELSCVGHPLNRTAQAEVKMLRPFRSLTNDELVSDESGLKILEAYGKSCDFLIIGIPNSLLSWSSLLQCREVKKLEVRWVLPPEVSISELLSVQHNLEEFRMWHPTRGMEVMEAVSMHGAGLKRLRLCSSVSPPETLVNMLRTEWEALFDHSR